MRKWGKYFLLKRNQMWVNHWLMGVLGFILRSFTFWQYSGSKLVTWLKLSLHICEEDSNFWSHRLLRAWNGIQFGFMYLYFSCNLSSTMLVECRVNNESYGLWSQGSHELAGQILCILVSYMTSKFMNLLISTQPRMQTSGRTNGCLLRSCKKQGRKFKSH